MDRRTDERTDGRTDGRMDERTDGQTDKFIYVVINMDNKGLQEVKVPHRV